MVNTVAADTGMKNLQGKAILVCGGASGIGAATVHRLSAEGASVGIGDFNIAGAEALAAELSAAGGKVVAWEYDQAEEATINGLVASAVSTYLVAWMACLPMWLTCKPSW